mgnify:CR=1 FL=1
MTDLLTTNADEIVHHFVTLRDEIVRQARAKWEAELVEAKRQAAWDALTACDFNGQYTDALLYRNRHYAPMPRSVTLSDGSVVTPGSYGVPGGQCWLFRDTPTGERKNVTLGQWPQLLRATDTGTDFDAVKQFAATVEAR